LGAWHEKLPERGTLFCLSDNQMIQTGGFYAKDKTH
jgi:hypothetical protein